MVKVQDMRAESAAAIGRQPGFGQHHSENLSRRFESKGGVMRPPILLALVACVASSAVGAESPRAFAPSVSLSKAIVISERPVRQSQALLGADGDAHLVVPGAKAGP